MFNKTISNPAGFRKNLCPVIMQSNHKQEVIHMGNGKKKARAAVLSVAGLAGTMLWQKKDWLKAMVQLRQYPDGWVVIQRNPEVFLTRTSEKSKENLFEYLS